MQCIWRISEKLRTDDFQREFMKFTAKEIIQHLRYTESDLVDKLKVNAKDLNMQVWKRDLNDN